MFPSLPVGLSKFFLATFLCNKVFVANWFALRGESQDAEEKFFLASSKAGLRGEKQTSGKVFS